MGSLLRYHLRRIVRGKYFYICSAVAIVMVILNALALKVTVEMFGGDPSVTSSSGLLFMKSGMNTGNFTILGGIIIAIFISEEYSQETIKNVYSKGFNRTTVFFATYIISLIAALVLFLLLTLFGFLSGLLFFGGVGNPGEGYVLSIIGLVLIAFAYHAIFFGISISMRKPAPSVALVIAGPLIVLALVSILDALVFKDASFKASSIWLSGRESAMIAENVSAEEFGKTVASTLLIAGIFLLASFFINRKREN